MIAYFFIAFISLLLSIILPSKTKKQWIWKLFWTFLPLFLFGALRVDFGLDYSTYEDLFEYIHKFGVKDNQHSEIGYQILCANLPTFRLLLILTAGLLSFALGFFCYHCVPRHYFWIVVLLLFINPEKNVHGPLVTMRNGLAVDALLIGVVWIQQRKWIWYSLLTLLMMTIHTSAIFFMPIAYLVGRNKILSWNEVLSWIVVASVLLLMSVSEIIDYVLPYISMVGEGRYTDVISNMQIHRGGLIVFVNIIFSIIFFYFFWNFRFQLTPKQNSIFRLGLLYLFSAFIGSLTTRMTMYYCMFYIATIVYIYSRRKYSSVLGIGVLLLAILVSYYSTFVVWMGSPYFSHETYHSLIGDF